MKKKLVTIVTPNIANDCREILDNQAAYAVANNYEHSIVAPFWENLHPSFSKVYEINKALEEGYDVVLWADADLAFTNHTFDLEQLLINDYFVAAYRQTDHPSYFYLCAGLTIWRKCERAKIFVGKWKQRCEQELGIAIDKPWEQTYFNGLALEKEYAGIRICTAREIGSFCWELWHDGTIWEPGMPTIHFAGSATWEKRREIFLQKYAPLVVRKAQGLL